MLRTIIGIHINLEIRDIIQLLFIYHDLLTRNL